LPAASTCQISTFAFGTAAQPAFTFTTLNVSVISVPALPSRISLRNRSVRDGNGPTVSLGMTALAALAMVSPIWLIALQTTGWLPNSAGMWLPAHLACFVGGMALAVLRSVGVRCYAWAALPLALIMFLIASTPIAGDVTMSPERLWQPLAKTVLYATIATLVVAPLALGDHGRYARLLSSRLMVRLGEISYEIFLLHVVVMAVAMNAVLRWPLFTGSMTGLIAVTLAITVPLAWRLQRITNPDTGQEARHHTATFGLGPPGAALQTCGSAPTPSLDRRIDAEADHRAESD